LRKASSFQLPASRAFRVFAALWVVLLGLGLWAVRDAGTALLVNVELDRPDAIVSLASHEWERLPAAAALALKNPSAKVLLTVPIAANPFNCHDCYHRIDRLVAAGVDEDRIVILPHRVFRTRDEAEAVREWAGSHGLRSVMVVTSAYHTRRALDTFWNMLAGTGIAVGVYPAGLSDVEPGRWWRHKYDRWYVGYEWRARVYYLIRFGVRWGS
jgi:uncharacterized SAM-binding protein YcdF (DUF218 family)